MKPPRFFPFPINVGTDICQISRIQAILQGPRASRFVDRILAPEERQTLVQRGLALNGSSKEDKDAEYKRAAFIAGR